MGTTFNAAAFRASSFMAALTVTDVLPDAEKLAAKRQAVVDRRESAWRMEGRIRALFFHARASKQDYINASHDGGGGDAFCQRNNEVVLGMAALLDAYVMIPFNGKTHAEERIKFLRTLRGHTSGGATFEKWKPAYQAWCAKLEAEHALFAATPTKKRGR